MGIQETWNNVYFHLELRVNVNHNATDEENSRKINKVAQEARKIIAKDYQRAYISKELIVKGTYGGESRGPAVYGATDRKTFEETFGDISRGISCLVSPLGLPCEIYVKWYESGNLSIPKELQGIVKGVFLTRFFTESFKEVDLWVPNGAKRY